MLGHIAVRMQATHRQHFPFSIHYGLAKVDFSQLEYSKLFLSNTIWLWVEKLSYHFGSYGSPFKISHFFSTTLFSTHCFCQGKKHHQLPWPARSGSWRPVAAGGKPDKLPKRLSIDVFLFWDCSMAVKTRFF